MKQSIKSVLRLVLPTPWRRRIRFWFGWRWFRGNYQSWQEARLASAGYEDRAILQRALAAARAVRQGAASWERDGFTFATPAVNEPLIAALLSAAASNAGRLIVTDIGGAFGGVLRQHWDILRQLESVTWRVVEQPDFVTAGQKEFSDSVLSFYSSLADACAGAQTQDVALLSSVLPYVESPMQLLTDVVSAGFEHVIVDRTPFARDNSTKLMVQHVPPELGGRSYPCWIFSQDGLMAELSPEYEKVGEWPGFDDLDPHVEFRGFHFRRKSRQLDGAAAAVHE